MEIKYININQTKTLLSIGKLTGYLIISLETNKILSEKITLEPIYIVELYYTSNIIFIVGDGKPLNEINIWDDKLEKYIGYIKNKNIITGVKINKNYVLIYDDYQLNIYNFNKLELIKTLNYKNYKCSDLSINMNNYLITTNSIGYINLYNIDNNKAIYFKAHDSPIQYLKISRLSKYIASVSEQGRKIKIFDLETTQLIKTLYRGIISSLIISIEFDNTDKYILVYSDTGTIHIYNILGENTKSLLNNMSNYMFNYDINNYEYSLYRLELKKLYKLCIMNNFEEIYVVDKDNISVTKYKLNMDMKYINNHIL